MKLITVIIIGVFTITSAIRVPTTWPKKQDVQRYNKFRTTNVGSEIGYQSRPHVAQKHNKVNSGRKFQQNERHRNLKKTQPKTEFKASAEMGGWKPIFPGHLLQNDDRFYHSFKEPPFQNEKPVKKSPLYKNYRDDKTHEPNEDVEAFEETRTHYEKPSSTHEIPSEIPTRPIYPGEGQWAKKGKKHRPFISKQKYTQPEGDEDEEKPEGREVFDENKYLFEKQRQKFRSNIDEFPRKHKLGSYLPAEKESEDDEEERQEFVPTKIYTQVRRTENEEHLPRLDEDPRLKELIKDSKIQTVYTEEGYEDLAYDHAGHEKKAEQDEGYSEFGQEIEKEKQRKARKLKEKGQDSEGAGSQYQMIKKPLQMKKNSFIKKEEVKTASVKDKDGRNAELEILSEVKVLEAPNNKTKMHKYVTIFPRTYRYDQSTASSVQTKTEIPEMLSLESAINRSVYRSRFGRRFKRFTVDFPEIKAETDFIDKIKHNLPKKAHKTVGKAKYPYYNDATIHPYSPLRYAEDLDNIPKKTEDDLAFYNNADRIECPEVQSNVDPIPRRVKSLNEDPENAEEPSGSPELVKGPRLKNLGDKIDCFKAKYFGENPLDSPFFQEKEIGPVLSIFKTYPPKEKQHFVKHVKIEEDEESYRSYSTKIPIQKELKEKKEKNPVSTQEDFSMNILSDVMSQFNKSRQQEATTTARSVLKLEIIHPKRPEKVENQTEASVISIITTPKYTIDLKPKHIYHQIELLEYLPIYNNKPTNKSSVERHGKSIDEETTTPSTTNEESPPESQALRHRRRRIRPRPVHPYSHIFDVNRYLPPNSFSLLNKIIRTSTISPKREVTSEVHYKDEIKPSEQLNVFADIINNIKNSSKDPQQIAASSNIAVKLNTIPVVETELDNIEETNSFYLSTTTVAPRRPIKYSSYKNKDHLFEDLAFRDRAKYENLELLKINKRLTTTTEPFKIRTRLTHPVVEEETEEEDVEEEEKEDTTGTVLGLMPPMPNRYKTIYSPKLTKPVTEETRMNLFYVPGMKPPSAKQKVYLYSDFKVHPHVKTKYSYLRRGKRSAQRPAYSEVVRNRNKPIDVEDDTEVVVDDDDDDYVPHRPKNYHYDEKTGKIVYDNVKKEEKEPEVEYIEVTEAPIPKPTRKNAVTAPKFVNFTGPSYVDFVKKLKNDPNYKEITDPPPTEKADDDVTTTTTANPVSTDPPEFLSILAKVRNNDNYKEIKDKTTTKTTTTEAAVTEEEEEETQLENVQNAPGGQSNNPNFQIFDINDYLPKMKTYSPRTSIDYSKYKTIERPSVSSRHNSEDEDSEGVKTTKVPILEEKSKVVEETEINPVMSESKHVEPVSTTTTTTTTTVATTRRIRGRPKPRGTRRPTRITTVASASTSASVTEEPPRVQHDKPRRVYPHRRPTRIKLNKTTTALPDLADAELEESTAAKVIRRRHQKSEDAPTNMKYKIVTPNQDEIAELNRTAKSNQTKGQLRKIADVQVFEKYDQTKKHGGNLKQDESESKKVHEVKRLTDVVHKPSEYYTDPKLPKKINHLIEVEVDDVPVEGGEESESENEETTVTDDFDYEGSEEKTTTTKKPLFVKDPDKRLYYYAPI